MNKQIERRRTFAIISHPDAGKTTLTEKFLLFGGQIPVAVGSQQYGQMCACGSFCRKNRRFGK